ncbi:hypothetical protein PSTG_03551 [Puccinia striiformis f. sp. tritici PST-78]|uniref:Uncharacterized protein n=1 Tax=Puccinia striiformis f. sp. tritici PST-78 TaxID=1165861 RepID=A0A0L0VVI7_9BASI|nr:hypothetical protein PSTG_03551 [Puccinia striiformis f. sp. tritici PST-78]
MINLVKCLCHSNASDCMGSICVTGPMQHQAGRMHDTAATAHRHMMTRPAAPNTSPADDGEVACAGVWGTGNGDACDQDRDDLYRPGQISRARGVLFGLYKNTLPVLSTLSGHNNIEDARNLKQGERTCSPQLKSERGIIYQPFYLSPSSVPRDPPVPSSATVTVPGRITGGEVGSTSEDYTNPVDEHWVTAQKAKGETQVDPQQLIAKIPQLRDISTIRARSELKDPRDKNQRLINSMKEDFDCLREGLKIYRIQTLSKISQRLRVIHDQIFWSMKNDLLNLKGMGLGFCISLSGATVAEATISENPSEKNPDLSQMNKAIKLTRQKQNASGEHLQDSSGPLNSKPVIDESNPNPHDPSGSTIKYKESQQILKNISKEFTFVSSETEAEAQIIPHLMMDCSTSQKVMKCWNRGILKDLKEIYHELLYRTNSGYSYRCETYQRLILQTVDFLYKHEMIDVGLFKSFYDTDQILESAAKNMVWNMHEVLDQRQKTKFEYAAHQYLFRLRIWNHVGTRGWTVRAFAWRKILFEENKKVKNDITLYKYLEKNSDNDPQKSHEVQDCLIRMIRYLDIDESLSYNAWKARRIEWRAIYQVLGFIQENYQEVFLELSHVDNQLEDKLELLRSSSQFLGELEKIKIYLTEYLLSRELWGSDPEMKQPRKNLMTCYEELDAIYEYVELMDKEHNEKHSDIETGNSLEPYLQREDVNSSVKLLKTRINNYQWAFSMGGACQNN